MQADEHSFLQRLALGEHPRIEYVPELWGEAEHLLIEAASARD